MAGFHFASLKIDRFASRKLFRGIERARIVRIDIQPIRVDTAHKKESSGSDRYRSATSKRHIDRYPSRTFEIYFRPVVQIHFSRMRHPSALPASRDSLITQHRNQQQGDLPAIALAVLDHIGRYIGNRRIFQRTRPRIMSRDIGVDGL